MASDNDISGNISKVNSGAVMGKRRRTRNPSPRAAYPVSSLRSPNRVRSIGNIAKGPTTNRRGSISGR